MGAEYIVLLCFILVLVANTTAIKDCTKNTRSFKELLTRKRRYAIFPDGSGVLATIAVLKSIEMNYPLGINALYELDIFYPLQTKVTDWHFKKAPPVPLHSKLDNVEDNVLRKSNPASTLNTYDSLNKGKYDRTDMLKINSIMPIPIEMTYQQFEKENERFWNKSSNHVDKWNKHQNIYENLMWQKSNATWQPYKKSYPSNIYNQPKSRRRQPLSYVNPNRGYYIPYSKSISPNNKARTFDIEDHKNWEHYNGHKERRSLYGQVEEFAKQNGYDFKACIQRLICEGRHYLLPPGKSLFQDIIRILFTIPLKEDMEDDYSNAMKANENECQENYGKKCRYSILGFLLHKDRDSFHY